MIKVRMIKFMALLAILASLFGCIKPEPQILDGPGMEYVDRDYRTEYANCLPFEDMRGEPYFAIAYLGKGDEGKENRQVYIDKVFASLENSTKDGIKHYDYEGDCWYLIIPKYKNTAYIKYADEEVIASYTGEAFTVKCNNDVIVNTFDVSDIDYALGVDDGVLENTDENIWDVTNLEQILKQ